MGWVGMVLKYKQMKKILIAIAVLFSLIYIACTKDEIQTAEEGDDIVEKRNGNFYDILHLTSLSTYHQEKPYQVGFNKDSVEVLEAKFAGQTTKALSLISGQKISAKLYNIQVTFKDSTTYTTNAWYKDTTNTFTYYPTGVNYFKGNFNRLSVIRTTDKITYYDTDFKKVKNKFKYNVGMACVCFCIPLRRIL